MDELLEIGINPNLKGIIIIFIFHSLLLIIINKGNSKFSAVIQAAAINSLPILRLLIKHGAKYNILEWGGIHYY